MLFENIILFMFNYYFVMFKLNSILFYLFYLYILFISYLFILYLIYLFFEYQISEIELILQLFFYLSIINISIIEYSH